MKEYQVLVYKESVFSSLIFGESKVDPEKFTEFLNSYAANGWKVITVEREMRRTALFFSREAFLVIMERER
jgi:hypothetical protein